MKNILYITLLTLVFVGCDDRLDDLNTDKKNPAAVPAASLFSQGLRELGDNIVSMSVNDNPFRMYSQMWAQTTYPDESQYTIASREISLAIFTNQYRDVLIDLKDAKSILQTEIDDQSTAFSDANLNNKIATIDILMGYTYLTMVDIFGNIPFSEALDPSNLNPVYDDAASIYDSIEEMMSSSSALLTANSTEGTFDSDADLIYGGDASAWATFANTLKLRMAMKLAEQSSEKSITWANEAMTAGVFTSNADNFSIAYESASPNSSPLHEDLVLSGRADFVVANTLTDKMNELLDPRMMTYARNSMEYGWNVDAGGNAQDSIFATNLIIENYDVDGNLTSTDYMVAPFTLAAADSTTLGDIRTYEGGIYGSANSYSGSSQVGDILHTPDLAGVLLNYAEVEFLMAEMAERGGYAVTGTVEEHYNAGITASFSQWGVSGVTDYLAVAEVAYATADGDWKQKIGTQMWLALYNQGLEAWSTWRRLDFDGFTPPPGMAMEDIPVRMTYPLREATLNGNSYDAASSAIGGDEVSTRLFWDME